jgi:23S rRNA pseudouridine1911/1915/1917 synthase
MKVLEQVKDHLIVIKEAGENSEKMGAEGYNALYRLDVPVRVILVLTSKGSTIEITGKEYLLVCSGKFEEDDIEMTDLLFHDSRTNRTFPVKRMRKGVKEAKLSAKILGYDEANDLTLASCVLGTGRTHQIRTQFASRKHPLAGDGKYGSRIKCPVALMCAGITYKTSASGETKTVRIEPEDAFPWNLFAKKERNL